MVEESTPLSDREMEIVQLLATGATNQQIARELFISVNTVKVHLRNIYAKLGVASRTEATMVAVRQGWVSVSQPGDEQEVTSARLPEAPPLPPLPRLERWPRVSLAKRFALLGAILVALAILFGPRALQEVGLAGILTPTSVAAPTRPATPEERWRPAAQMPTPRSGLAVVAYDNLLYAIGGLADGGVMAGVEVYDAQADVWTGRRPKPTAAGLVSAAAVGTKIYVPGGMGDSRSYLDVLEVYDPAADTWQTGAPLPLPLAAYGLAVHDGLIYLFGGRGDEGYVASVYRYDPAADTWATLAPMERARGYLGAATLHDRIYVVGGYDDNVEMDTCQVYDPTTEQWAACAPLGQGRGGLALVAVREKLYAIGGGMTQPLTFNETYDPFTDQWNRIETPIPEEWQGLGADFISPYVYAVGGWQDGPLAVNQAYKALYVLFTP